MNEFAAAAPSCRNVLLPGGASNFRRCPIKLIPKWQCNISRLGKKQKRSTKVEAQMVNPSTYSSRISTDISLYEIPGASFDQYLEDKPRVFKAIFPDKRRSNQLNEDEWRVHMLPIEFLFLTVSPVIDMRLRCKSSGTEYPPGVPQDISKVLQLDIIRWELQGLDEMLKPSQFSLGVKGALYPDRRGPRCRLRGQLNMSISFVLPPMLGLVPEDIRRDVAESVLKRLVENMKDKVNSSLISDYNEFKRERPKALA
ncbi:hypothetical protein ABFS82_08G025800 [Erythranthe guttata]|uniref:DUF1997 family protein n=1 Tax=Erythranthe guttata TaxID=4155 RepID=A0A022RVZ1_ERYGU|nr:PREDICTED: uncharacterized protein LOC105970886 isoform X1 [Erythranthe guttata]EYU44136.1 hypothetical protein MIMGU_mgv1a012305mg [Erythranthe guttata]|eukprot:XP_012851160.1 PREDICTED: uncharacterized protein LOC105970886 isoform X1 [Erythranthe guttata]